MSGLFTVMKTERNYRWFTAANIISGLGDWFHSVAVLSLVLRLTGSGLAVGITLALRTLPYLFMGPLAGVIADRFPRKWVMVFCDIGRALFVLTFLFATTASRIWVVYAATLLLLVFSTVYTPARSAITPQMVKPEHLASANAFNESTGGVVMALGAALGGVATAALGVQIAFILNALSFVASAWMTWQLRLQPVPHQESTGQASWRDLLPVIRRSRLVLVVTVLNVMWPIGGGVINVLLSVYAFQVFHAGNVGVGIMYGSLGVGFILGGLVASHVTAYLRWGSIVGVTIEGIAHVWVSQSSSIWMAALALLVATIGAGVSNPCIDTLVMREVPPAYHGRIFALFGSVSGAVLGLSLMVGGALLQWVSPTTLGLLSGLFIAGSGLVMGFLMKSTSTSSIAVQSAEV